MHATLTQRLTQQVSATTTPMRLLQSGGYGRDGKAPPLPANFGRGVGSTHVSAAA